MSTITEIRRDFRLVPSLAHLQPRACECESVRCGASCLLRCVRLVCCRAFIEFITVRRACRSALIGFITEHANQLEVRMGRCQM